MCICIVYMYIRVYVYIYVYVFCRPVAFAVSRVSLKENGLSTLTSMENWKKYSN